MSGTTGKRVREEMSGFGPPGNVGLARIGAQERAGALDLFPDERIECTATRVRCTIGPSTVGLGSLYITTQ